MRALFDICLKDLTIVSRDRGAWMLLLVTPIVVIMVASFALAPAFQSDGIEADLLVANHDSGEVGQKLVESLQARGNITIVAADDQQSQTLKIGNDKYPASLIIPEGFTASFNAGQPTGVQMYVDPVREALGSYLQEVIEAATSNLAAIEVATSVAVQSAMTANPRADQAAVTAAASEQAEQAMAEPPVKTTVTSISEQEINSFDRQVPGYSVMFLLFGVLSAAEGLILERESGTLGRLLVAPISRTAILGGKLSAQFLVGLAQIIILFAIGHFVFGMNTGNSLAGLALMLVMTAWTATAFGILLAGVARTRRQVSAIGILTILLMSALGGSWWPLDIVPDFMQKLGHITINAWALDGLNDLILRGQDFADILPEAGVLLAYGTACFLVGIRLFRFRSA